MNGKDKNESVKTSTMEMSRRQRVINSIKQHRKGIVLGKKLNIKKLINKGRK